MKKLTVAFPTQYIVVAKDTDGNLWQAYRTPYGLPTFREIEGKVTRAQLTNLAHARLLETAVRNLPDEYWVHPLEDSEDGDIPLLLLRHTVSLHRVKSTITKVVKAGRLVAPK